MTWTKGPILALDLASKTGFCVGKPGEKPRFGTIRLGSEGATPAEKGCAFWHWFSDMVAVEDPWAIAFETSMNPAVSLRVGNGAAGLRFTMGLNYLAEIAANLKGIGMIRQVDVDDHRKHFLGRARFKGGSGEAKRACVARCRMIGWEVKDDNAADACAIWDYACAVWASKLVAQQQFERSMGVMS